MFVCFVFFYMSLCMYIYSCHIFTNRSISVNNSYFILFSNQDAQHLLKSEQAVIHMMAGLMGEWRHVYIDNWYCSVKLAEFLFHRRQTFMTGIVASGRGPPHVLHDEVLNRQQSSFARKGVVLICKYQDRKTLYAITTM